MVKILGLAAILISSVMTGIVMSRELYERVSVLKDIRNSAIHIKNELEYRCATLEECFRGRGSFFSKVYNCMCKNTFSPKDAVERTIQETNYLSRKDKEILESYAQNLWCEDISSQIVNIELLIASLNESIRESEADCLDRGKLYSCGGVLAGLGFIIILL